MGFGFVVERFGLLLRIMGNQPLSPLQRGLSLWIGVGLLVLGGSAAVVSALQFRKLVGRLGEQEIPRGYWINTGVWLNFTLAAVALVLAVHFVVGS